MTLIHEEKEGEKKEEEIKKRVRAME